MNTQRPIPAAILCICLLGTTPAVTAAAAAAERIGCYISVGDNDWVWQSPPVNSRASIEALFDCLQKVFNVQRIYWRGIQSQDIAENYLVRPENFQGSAFWEWERHLVQKVGTTTAAVEAAHRRGLDFWGFTALFDHGGHPRIDAAKLGTPAPIEDRLRIEHPEVVPVDRHGIRRQAGPIELAYEDVRTQLVYRYVDLVNRCDYDGLMFYTYVEHFSLRFEDEYGYNDPIVDEFRRRYGQDIRKENFDKNAWYRLRGEYVTSFLRELHAALAKHGKKLGVAIDPQDPHLPAPWLCARDIRPTGRIYMDWETWVREGIVDEIMVYCNGSLEAALNTAVAVTAGTDCHVSTLHSAPFPPHHAHFADSGVQRVMVGSYDYIEWGVKEPQTADALDGEAPLTKLRALRQVEEKQLTVPLAKVTACLRDPNVLVRRQTIRTLTAIGGDEARSAVAAALDDAETGVRCVALDALTKLGGAGTPARVFAAIRARTSFQFENAATSCLANLPETLTSEIVAGCRDPDPQVRRVTVFALGRGNRRPKATPELIRALADPVDYVRFCAGYSLSRSTADPAVGDALLQRLAVEEHPSVRNRIAITLGQCFRSNSRWVSQRQLAALRALERCFQSLGQSPGPPDADWSFRPVGNALLGLGPRGREALERMLTQTVDPQFADLIWRVLHVPQTGWNYVTCTEAEAAEGYRQHPKLRPPNTTLAKPPTEPETMPYIRQTFDDLTCYKGGKLGNMLDETAQWRTLGEVSPEPVVQSVFHRGEKGHALRLQRGGKDTHHWLEAVRADYRLATEPTTVEFWLLRTTRDASLAVTWKDSGTSVVPVGVFIPSDSSVRVMQDGTWSKTEASFPHGSWQRVRFDIDPGERTYSVRVGAEELTLARADIPLPDATTYNILTFSPQAPEGRAIYVDDVSVTVPNPAHKPTD